MDMPLDDIEMPAEPPEIPEIADAPAADLPEVSNDAPEAEELPVTPEPPEEADIGPADTGGGDAPPPSNDNPEPESAPDTGLFTGHPTRGGNPEIEVNSENQPFTIHPNSPEGGYGGGGETRGKVMDDMTGGDAPGEVSEPAPEIEPETSGELDQQIREASERLGQMPDLQPDAWQQLDSTRRIEALQGAEAAMAEIQGRPAVPVVAAEMSPNTFGGFDGQQIQVNAGTLEGDYLPSSEFVDTIVHEGRHAYQEYAVENPGFEADTALVNSWAENMQPGNYLTPELYGQEAYAGQPIEADAWNYASQVVQGMKGRQP